MSDEEIQRSLALRVEMTDDDAKLLGLDVADCGVCLDGAAPCPVIDPPGVTVWTCLACGQLVGKPGSFMAAIEQTRAAIREKGLEVDAREWLGEDHPAITFDVLGTPAPKGSYRAFVNKRTGRAILAPSGSDSRKKRIAAWCKAVREACERAFEGSPMFRGRALLVTIEFRLTRPRGHYGTGRNAHVLKAKAPAWPDGKPDVDKLARCTLDVLTGIAYDDDSRIVDLGVSKVWACEGNEGASISVMEVST